MDIIRRNYMLITSVSRRVNTLTQSESFKFLINFFFSVGKF